MQVCNGSGHGDGEITGGGLHGDFLRGGNRENCCTGSGREVSGIDLAVLADIQVTGGGGSGELLRGDDRIHIAGGGIKLDFIRGHGGDAHIGGGCVDIDVFENDALGQGHGQGFLQVIENGQLGFGILDPQGCAVQPPAEFFIFRGGSVGNLGDADAGTGVILDVDLAGGPVDVQVFHGGGDFSIADGIFIRIREGGQAQADADLASEDGVGAAGQAEQNDNEGNNQNS